MPNQHQEPYNDLRAIHEAIHDRDEVHNFLLTRLGQKMMDDIDGEVEAYTEQLKKADPHKPELVLKVQREIWIREYLKIWFNSKLIEGEAALEITESQDSQI